MGRQYLAFDIETASTVEADDWRTCRPLGITCAAAVASERVVAPERVTSRQVSVYVGVDIMECGPRHYVSLLLLPLTRCIPAYAGEPGADSDDVRCLPLHPRVPHATVLSTGWAILAAFAG